VSRSAVAIAAAALAAVLVSNQLDLALDRLGVGALNANWEFSWSHDVVRLVLAIGVLIAVTGAWRDPGRRGVWLGTAAIFAVLFLDEASSLHGAISNQAGGKLLYAPLLLALVVCLWRLSAGTRERADLTLGLMLLCASFFMHTVGLHFLRTVGYWTEAYQAGVGVKEGCELAGLLVVVLVLYRIRKAQSGL
jgi:hypothetical protein